MVGRSLEQMFPPLAQPSEDIVFDVRQLASPAGYFKNISFQVRRGEIFGIAGLIGAGRTELVRAIAGADPIANGSVLLEGRDGLGYCGTYQGARPVEYQALWCQGPWPSASKRTIRRKSAESSDRQVADTRTQSGAVG